MTHAIGITGHQSLNDLSGWSVIRAQLVRHLEDVGQPLVGLSSLAIGSDQLFALEILNQNGSLKAIIPFPGYESKFDVAARPLFDDLVRQAAAITVLDRVGTDEESYLAAGRFIVDNCEELVAIWDGHPAVGLGGTADVVGYARQAGRPVHWIDASPWRHPQS
jgi:hypothetical protein